MTGRGPEVDSPAPTRIPTIVLDCRWLGRAGAGRVTELALRDLRRLGPRWHVILCGDPARIEPLWPSGAEVRRSAADPRRRLGQSGRRAVPRGDVNVYFHQIRIARPGPSVTFVYDTIPLRHGGSRPSRALKRLYFRLVARMSSAIVTISPESREHIEQDLGMPADRVPIARLPVEGDRFDRIRIARTSRAPEDLALFVGRFAPHKNLRRLVEAFGRSEFGRAGGRLQLVGGDPSECREMERFVVESGVDRVAVAGTCPEDRLDELLARCRLLAAPSLEEGFGLPAYEAATCGIPVVVTRTGGMGDLPDRLAAFCDPLSVASIAAAIDDAARRPLPIPPHSTPGDLGTTIIKAVERVLRDRAG
jgi:glycosyltransferase involved in cell wall biosynthesis